MRRTERPDGPTGELRLLRRAALALVVPALAGAWLSYRTHHAAPEAPDAAIGATFAPLAPPRAAPLLVTSLRAGGAADRAGLRVGDRLDTIDGHAAGSLADVEREMASPRAVALRVHRGADAVALRIAAREEVFDVDEDPAGRGRRDDR